MLEGCPISEQAPIGFIAGTSLLDAGFFDGFSIETVETEWESVNVYCTEEVVAIQRHESPDGYRPPHRIHHRANIQALAKRNVQKVFALNSCGSLQEGVEPGSFLLPDDFINPWAPVTFFDDERGHGVRQVDEELRREISESLSSTNDSFYEEGVYVQTLGPRFETPAEAEMLASFGEVVGMTAASEMTLASEQGISYATLCSVDNYVNGIAGEYVDLESFEASVQKHLPEVIRAVQTVFRDVFQVSLPESSQ